MSELLSILGDPPPLTADQRRRRMENYVNALSLAVAKNLPAYAQGLVQPVAGVPGRQELVAGASPAAGASYRFRTPGEYIIRPLSVLCQLATSAAVGDRTLTLEYQDSDDVRYLVAGTQAALTALQTQSFCWHPLAGDVAWPVDDVAIAPLPQQMIYPSSSLVIKIGNVQVGDQISLVRIVVEKYETGEGRS